MWKLLLEIEVELRQVVSKYSSFLVAFVKVNNNLNLTGLSG